VDHGRAAPTPVVLALAGRARRSLTVALATFGLLATACAPALSLSYVNRTTSRIAFLPGIVVEPCSTSTFSAEELARGREAQEADFLNEDWIPAGAVRYNGPMLAIDDSLAGPVSIVITQDGIAWEMGMVDDAALPACAGVSPVEGRVIQIDESAARS
jgi:hypothetical protein